MKNILLKKYSKWISTEEIEVLNHNLNYSNWTDTYACEGKWKVEFVKKGKTNEELNIYMPTARWGESHSGYWTIYSGRMKILEKELLIWQNNEQPVRLSYLENKNLVNLVIFGRQITFEKE